MTRTHGSTKGVGTEMTNERLVSCRGIRALGDSLRCRCRAGGFPLASGSRRSLGLGRRLGSLPLRGNLRLRRFRSLLLCELFAVEITHDAGYVMSCLLVGRNPVVLLDALRSRVVSRERLDEIEVIAL